MGGLDIGRSRHSKSFEKKPSAGRVSRFFVKLHARILPSLEAEPHSGYYTPILFVDSSKCFSKAASPSEKLLASCCVFFGRLPGFPRTLQLSSGYCLLVHVKATLHKKLLPLVAECSRPLARTNNAWRDAKTQL